MRSYREFIVEAASRSLSRLHGAIQSGHMVGLLSASRGNLSPAENNRRTRELKSELRKRGYTPVPVRGEYIEDHNGEKKKVREKSFMIHSGQNPEATSRIPERERHATLMAHVKALGSKFDQDSVLTVSKKHGSVFHGTGKSEWVPKGKRARIGGAGLKSGPEVEAGEFKSRLKRRPFIVGGGA